MTRLIECRPVQQIQPVTKVTKLSKLREVNRDLKFKNSTWNVDGMEESIRKASSRGPGEHPIPIGKEAFFFDYEAPKNGETLD